ncbi:MAG: hypothetical protein HFI82_09650, partial [Eubacterium sp.]|nr:hypothetical protein [Eubacterium sp.]
VSINPETPVQAIEDVLDMVHMVLVMSVHPGFAHTGGWFVPASQFS